MESIRVFSAMQLGKADNDGATNPRSARLAELRQALPRLGLIIAAAAIVIFGFPHLLAWLF